MPRAGSELGRRLDDLLEVVEQEQQLALYRCTQPGRPGRRGLGHRGQATSAGSRSEARPTQKTPFPDSGTSSAAASIASRVLPVPPGPVRVTRRAPSRRSAADRLQLALAADEARHGTGQVHVRGRLQRRESLVAELEDPDRIREVLEAMLAEIEHARRPRPARRWSPRARTCPPCPAAPMRAARWTSRDRRSRSAVERRLTGVDAHADANRGAGSPGCRRGSVAPPRRPSPAALGRRERDEQRIALRAHLASAVRGRRRCANPRPMLVEDRLVGRSPSAASNRVEPSMSVKRNVTVPCGSSRTGR